MTQRLNFVLSEDEVGKLKNMAASRKITMTDLLREMIDNAYQNNASNDSAMEQIKNDTKQIAKALVAMDEVHRKEVGLLKQIMVRSMAMIMIDAENKNGAENMNKWVDRVRDAERDLTVKYGVDHD